MLAYESPQCPMIKPMILLTIILTGHCLHSEACVGFYNMQYLPI